MIIKGHKECIETLNDFVQRIYRLERITKILSHDFSRDEIKIIGINNNIDAIHNYLNVKNIHGKLVPRTFCECCGQETTETGKHKKGKENV